ncbi:hypothetical protein EDD27_5373 [Nonomuraea polychroma]|uniref:Uncharacterized protein n=1 Tax=Nonomuraea polychroma TaxID=46176 RepID=A0A438MAI2_9ACTN|nr:hypothetical protein [Nonomuraea polychroma]RVX42724.1 hypothetical protein EDD27_5373 [Nonomuraea polychroma]
MAMERNRGSDALLEMYKQGGYKLDDDSVSQLVELLADLDVHDVLVKGQPAPDYLRATIQVEDPDRCGAVTGGLMGLIRRYGTAKLPGTIKVFPKGIPFPDRFVIDLVIAEQQRF